MEITLVLLTGLLHLVFEGLLHQKAIFLVAAVCFWLAYAIWQWRKQPGSAARWGMRPVRWRQSLVANGLVLVAGGVGMLAWGFGHGRSLELGETAALFVLYPIWGITQQFLLGALFCRNLSVLLRQQWIAALLSALGFALVHAPDWTLSAMTGVAGIFWALFWLRWPNLWIQGICHGWLGALAYPLVLGQHPLREMLEQVGLG